MSCRNHSRDEHVFLSPLVLADATQLRQIVLNLVTNAAEATDGSGTITLTTAQRLLDTAALRPMAHDWILPPGAYVLLEVRDSGRGMDEQTRLRLFEPFFTTKASGRGLGLAAVLGILRRHQGSIAVTSAPQQGTTFTIVLPRATGPLAAEPTRLLRVASADQPRTMLIIDDEDEVRDVAARILARLGHRTLLAASGEAGASLLMQTRVDAVLMDLTLPPPSGTALIALLRRTQPGVPIVVMSGFSEAKVMRQLAAMQPLIFVARPFGVVELHQAFQLVLQE